MTPIDDRCAVERLDAHAVIDDDAVAVDPELVGEDHLAAVRRDDRHAGERREVEAEVRLLVDFLALVDVGALVGERGLDGVVGERVEDDAAPVHLGRALLREARQSSRRSSGAARR